MLPKSKITEAIAEARGLQYPALEDCNSPPRHSAFDDPVGLMMFVAQLRELSGGKPIGFKLCIGKAEEFSALCHAMIETGITPVSFTLINDFAKFEINFRCITSYTCIKFEIK